jgi:UPF0716 protein FxsA
MAWLVILTVIAVPVIEIALFVQSAHWIGVLPTIVLALAAGVAGIALVRAQGLMTMGRVQAQLNRGEMPVAEMFDGLCLAVAGGLLVLPGFMTDILAILLLLPPVRAGLRLWLARRVVVVPPDAAPGPTVIDGEFTVVEDVPPPPRLRDDDSRR